MKQLIDGKLVPAGVYYYLLDWNERDSWHTIQRLFKVISLRQLTCLQFLDLFQYAVKQDSEDIIKINKPLILKFDDAK
jgi:hypothetical protein